MTYSTEIVRRVFDDDSGNFLSVRPSADFPDTNVLLHAEASEKEYFGETDLDLPLEFMRQLGQALIDCANDIESKK